MELEVFKLVYVYRTGKMQGSSNLTFACTDLRAHKMVFRTCLCMQKCMCIKKLLWVLIYIV